MVVAIVGSRDYRALEAVDEYVNMLAMETYVISGGARGVDRRAYYRAKRRERDGTLAGAREIAAEWDRYGRERAGFIRNQKLVEEADAVVAFWDEESKGTLDCMLRAYLADKLDTVFGHDGERMDRSEWERLVVSEIIDIRHEDMRLARERF
jgi:hypothetical protein